MAAYSPSGWLGCADVQLGRTSQGLALRWVMSSAPATVRIGVLRRADVVVDGQRLEGGERADQHRHVQALDQFLRLGARLRRIAGGVGGVQLDRPAGELVVALLEEDREALLHLDAAGGERAGLDGEEADLDGTGLRDRGRNLQRLRWQCRRRALL